MTSMKCKIMTWLMAFFTVITTSFVPVRADKFDDRKVELNGIKTAFNEFADKALNIEKIYGKKLNVLSDIRTRFDKLFDILYSTNENNRIKGYKDYSTYVPDAKSKFESCNIFDAKEAYDQTCPCRLGKARSVLEVTKCVVDNIYSKLNYFPLVIRKRISNCLYKLIDGKDSKETDEMRFDVSEEKYPSSVKSMLYFQDLPCISGLVSKFGIEPPLVDLINLKYEEKFNLLVDGEALIKLMKLIDRLKYSKRDEEIENLKMTVKELEFTYNQAEKDGIGTKEVIDNVKNVIKIASDDLKAGKLPPNKDEIDYLETIYRKTEDIVKSSYGFPDEESFYQTIYFVCFA